MTVEGPQLFSVGKGVQTGRFVGAATENPTVFRERDAEDFVAETGDALHFLRVGDVPAAKALVAAARDGGLAVRRDADPENRFAVAVKRNERISCPGIEDLGRFIATGRDELRA